MRGGQIAAKYLTQRGAKLDTIDCNENQVFHHALPIVDPNRTTLMKRDYSILEILKETEREAITSLVYAKFGPILLFYWQPIWKSSEYKMNGH